LSGIRWDWDSEHCRCDPYSPILIDTAGNGFDLTNANNGVDFDLKPDGVTERIAWTRANSDDAFLVLDRNGNGRIDDGTELFGNFTAQPASAARNGFLALAEFDKGEHGGNDNEVIDRGDSVFGVLRLWKDLNHDGLSGPGEMVTLAAAGIARMDLEYWLSNRRDEYGNRFRYRAKVYDSRGAQVGRWAWDVFLAS
jgi:hypothetical protein